MSTTGQGIFVLRRFTLFPILMTLLDFFFFFPNNCLRTDFHFCSSLIRMHWAHEASTDFASDIEDQK